MPLRKALPWKHKYSRASRIDIELSPDNFWEKSQNLVASI